MPQQVNNSVQSSYWETLSADYFLGWLDCYELFPFCKQHVCYENWILKFWSRWSVQKNLTCSKSGSDYVFKFKDSLLNALFLFNKCAIECFQNVFFMAFFIVTFLLFNSCFLQHNQKYLHETTLLNLENWNCWIQLNLSLIIWYPVFTSLGYNSYYGINDNMLFFVFYIDFYIFYNFSIQCIWQSQTNI